MRLRSDPPSLCVCRDTLGTFPPLPACACGREALCTPVLPLEAVLADKRSEGGSSIRPSLHPSIHPSTLSPRAQAGPFARARRSVARPSLPRPAGAGPWKSIKAGVSVRTSSRVGLALPRSPGEHNREEGKKKRGERVGGSGRELQTSCSRASFFLRN